MAFHGIFIDTIVKILSARVRAMGSLVCAERIQWVPEVGRRLRHLQADRQSLFALRDRGDVTEADLALYLIVEEVFQNTLDDAYHQLGEPTLLDFINILKSRSSNGTASNRIPP